MLGPGLDWKLRDVYVEEFYRAVAACSQNLRFVRFRPGAIEEGVLSIEPTVSVSIYGLRDMRM